MVAEEELEEEYNPPEGDEDYEIYPKYYVNDPEGPKPGNRFRKGAIHE